MEMQGLSDEDLTAVISYLRTQPAVRNAVPAHEYSLLGRIVRATVLANPVGPGEPPPAASPRGAAVETGRYLVRSVALCGACHTQRDENTGALTGPLLGGATGFTVPDDNTRTWSPPNITNDPTTGRLARFTEDESIASDAGGSRDSRFPHAVAGLPAHGRRRPAGDLPLRPDGAPGDQRRGAAAGGDEEVTGALARTGDADTAPARHRETSGAARPGRAGDQG